MAQRVKSGQSSLSAKLSALLGWFGGRAVAPKKPSAMRGPYATDPQVASRRKSIGMAEQTLRSGLKSGKFTQEEYATRVAQLSGSRSA